VFRESDYQLAEQRLRDVFLRGGFAHVETSRKAEVSTDERHVRIGYTINPGPPTVFGDTEIRGTDRVDSSLIEAGVGLSWR
jgi:outer membrane translocation and assembly module TamA